MLPNEWISMPKTLEQEEEEKKGQETEMENVKGIKKE